MIGISGDVSLSTNTVANLTGVSLYSGSNVLVDANGYLRSESLAGLVPIASLDIQSISDLVYRGFPSAFTSFFTYGALGPAPWTSLSNAVTYSNIGPAPWASLSNAVTYSNLGPAPWRALSNAVTYDNLGDVPWSALSSSVSYRNIGPIPPSSLANVTHADLGPIGWPLLSNVFTYSNIGPPDLSVLRDWVAQGLPPGSIPPSALSNLSYSDVRGTVPASAIPCNVVTRDNFVSVMISLGYGPPPMFPPFGCGHRC